jgi:hypothetical protein
VGGQGASTGAVVAGGRAHVGQHLPIKKAALDVTLHSEGLVVGLSQHHQYTLGTEMNEGSRSGGAARECARGIPSSSRSKMPFIALPATTHAPKSTLPPFPTEKLLAIYTDSDLNAFNGILRNAAAGSAAQKLSMLELFPISPPDNATGNNFGSARGHITPTKHPATKVEFTKLKVEDQGERVAYISLGRVGRDKVGALTFSCTTADATPTASRATQAPIWWLPWQSLHMVKMKIAPQGTLVLDSLGQQLPNPDIFFTAAVSGCSVFVRGDPSAPSIYHGGIDGKLVDSKQGKFLNRGIFNKKQFDRLGGSTPAFWRQVLSGMDYDAEEGHSTDMKKTAGANKFNRPNSPVAEINTTHYTSDKGTKTTVNSRAFEKFLTKQAQAKGRQIDVVQPWGAVFGLRDGLNWTFYLQQNVTVIYTKLIGNQRVSDCVVLACTPFFPGSGEAKPPRLETRDFARIEHLLA